MLVLTLKRIYPVCKLSKAERQEQAMNYIRWFHEVGKSESGLVGGKGANLGELTQAGLPVPPGFCVTSSAYQDFFHQNGLDQQVADILAGLNVDDLDDVKRRSAQIQAAIYTAPISPEIVDEVSVGYQQLFDRTSSETALAVRSSATAEDQANASFAGQLETYLNVRGVPSLLEHIQHCWASLWAERVLAYIANQGLEHRSVSMSVVVQSMIPSEVSGVLFTVNPITGNRDEAVINASWGLGEAIVSGLVSPDTITAQKSDGRVISYQTGEKELMVCYAAQGGTEELPVPDHQRSRPALTEKQVAELTLLGKQIEAYYGKPQDIEWGYYNGGWYLLQSRPITTLSQQPERHFPPGDFNRSMFIEIFPETLSPSFLSVITPLFHGMLDFTFRALGFEPPKDMQATGGFYNQLYFNREYIATALKPLSPAVREPLVGQMVNPFGDHPEAVSFELSWPYLRMMFRILRFMVRFPKQLPGLLSNYQADIARVDEYPCEIAPAAEICDQISRLCFEQASRLINYDFLMIAVIGRSYRVLGALLKRYYQADTEELVAKLISGVTGNITMETNKRLWDLAQIARSTPAVGAVIRENDLLHARIILQKSDEGLKFLKAMDQFIDEFGHREVHMDILYPTWCEDPEPVYSFVRSYLDSDESQSPYRQQARLIKEREDLTRMVVKDLEKSIQGRLILTPIFRWFLKQTQLHTRERDTMHFEMTRLIPQLRRLALEMGERWAAWGYLDQKEDVFFLELDEMIEMAKFPYPVQEEIQSRKKTFVDNKGQPAPLMIRDGEEIYSARTKTTEIGEAGLQGVAGSPGRATGVSRIIQGPEDFAKLKKGEILVAPITNPVWTPLFAVASGVITEVGGILSHGAIVAREYGIPAVMSVSGATRLLQDGQRITVDGNKGLVYLEEEA
jgi:phosphohistidine swiveling domain-containing protein